MHVALSVFDFCCFFFSRETKAVFAYKISEHLLHLSTLCIYIQGLLKGLLDGGHDTSSKAVSTPQRQPSPAPSDPSTESTPASHASPPSNNNGNNNSTNAPHAGGGGGGAIGAVMHPFVSAANAEKLAANMASDWWAWLDHSCSAAASVVVSAPTAVEVASEKHNDSFSILSSPGVYGSPNTFNSYNYRDGDGDNTSITGTSVATGHQQGASNGGGGGSGVGSNVGSGNGNGGGHTRALTRAEKRASKRASKRGTANQWAVQHARRVGDATKLVSLRCCYGNAHCLFFSFPYSRGHCTLI